MFSKRLKSRFRHRDADAFYGSKLIKATIEEEAVNGIVSDAAHRVWQERNSFLIVSSTFVADHFKCWVPGIMSYANDGTAEHYRIHLFHLFMEGRGRGTGSTKNGGDRRLEVEEY